MEVKFPRATSDQAEALSKVAIESKAHWGYSNELIEVWRDIMKVEEAYITENMVRSIVADGETVGFFAIKRSDDEDILDHLWLLPKAIGRGIGKQAFEEIKKECRLLGIEEFVVISDPNAEGFYLRQGCERIGQVESKPQKRMLPKLRYRL